MEDYDIIRQVKAGDPEAFALLVERYHRQLLNFIFRIVRDPAVVEDIGQEVFLNVYKSLKEFDEDRGTPFSAWLFIAARNRCLSELRSRNRKEKIFVEVIADVRSGQRSAEEALMADQLLGALHQCLGQLPEPYRGAILRSLEGDSLRDIAERDGISLGTVKSRLFRARKMIKAFLNEYYGGGYEGI
jgi:RNA polymerase sigma-70 factor (ECF subfamily)